MKIAIVGTGYVGLVTGTCLAESGNQVWCMDIAASKIADLQAGTVPMYEAGLHELVSQNHQAGRLHFTTSLQTAVRAAEVVFLALPTPPKASGSADTSYILAVAEQLGPLLAPHAIIINKSTVPVGTADAVRSVIAKTCPVDFDVVSNPEFLREGLAVQDFMHPDRVVVGTRSELAKAKLTKLYAPFTDAAHPILWMDERSAELAKYAANTFLAMKINYINEIANICEQTGADVDAVRSVLGSDPRVGAQFLQPGIGYGGSCFPKDVRALRSIAEDHGYDFALLDAVIQRNTTQKLRLLEKAQAYFEGDLVGKVFALWGLAFKPGTDDIREAPALALIEELLKAGAHVVAFDPKAGERVREHFKDEMGLAVVEDQYRVLEKADALFIATEWQNFKDADKTRVKKLLKEPVIFDGRNIYEPQKMRDLGFHYESIGRS